MTAVSRRHGAAVFTATVALMVCAAAAAVYGLRLTGRLPGAGYAPLAWLWLPVLALLIGQTALYCGSRPHRARPDQQPALDRLHTTVLVPVYNEDEGYLRATLSSLLAQSRWPHCVHVVDDGSTQPYPGVQQWWLAAARTAGVDASWTRTDNRGKRHAQVTAAAHCPHAQILVTVDSDAQLAPDALHELLQPFADARVQAVAGLVLASNNRRGVLSRMTDLWYTTMQLVDRSALSALGAVLVSSGSLAAYRAEILRDHTPSYLGETFLGRPVTFSDDSLLTLFALTRGRVVQQTSAVVFTAMPEKVGHHVRQYVRWMRGSTIRSLWRARHLPLSHPAYAAQLARWLQQATYTAALAYLTAVHLRQQQPPSPLLLAVPFLVTASQTLRYLTIRRDDEPLRSQIATFALTPLALLWSWTVLRPARWYATVTCARTGWGTRTGGPEVTLTPHPAAS